ncbi:MAG TPA: tRNA pseudouridine(55) synthase TruB [Vicinamibacterales bacterium]|jgi:tRNA pseudouridine55 synthase|nr:tRNA pseudouridine(55) synthase TruB [Vicinamibacterales bacterium]
MDGLLIVDKPRGPTSHDVVARMRRALGERRIGHTGTLDPMASGVLPLVLGRATRLAQFLSGSDKHYDAIITLGVETDTYDALGTPIGAPYEGPFPDRTAVDRALDQFRGAFLQQPPAYSAKKIAGVRSYKLARTRRSEAEAHPGAGGAEADLPVPVSVTTHAIDLVAVSGATVTLSVSCSAGFYVRSLAHDLGRALGAGGCLSALRRTGSGAATLAQAVPLDEAERDTDTAIRSIVPMRALLVDLPCAVLTGEGRSHALHGRELSDTDFVSQAPREPRIRLLDQAGELVGIAGAGRAPGLLHPSVILM